MAISHEIIAVTKIHWYCQKLHIGKDPGTEERFVARGGDEDQMQHCPRIPGTLSKDHSH